MCGLGALAMAVGTGWGGVASWPEKGGEDGVCGGVGGSGGCSMSGLRKKIRREKFRAERRKKKREC